jgi:hypothetical protein
LLDAANKILTGQPLGMDTSLMLAVRPKEEGGK